MPTVAFIRGTGIYDDSRATKEIVTLANAGYRVEVLGWDRGGHAVQQCKAAFANVAESVNFSFFNVRAENGIGIRNIDKLFGWLRWIHKTLRKMENLSIVHACDLDAGIAAYQYCKKYRTKLVYDIFDYYIDAHSVPSVMRSMVEGIEINIINNADVTIICTEERKEQICKATPKKLVVVHNSPEMESMPEVAEDIDYFYCGALAGKRLIFEKLDTYHSNSDLKVIYAGYGPHSKFAEELAEQHENFVFLGTLPYSRVLQTAARSRVLSAIYEPTIRNHRLCAPNKFYEALALGKPVIVCRGTGIDEIVEQNDIGSVIDYDASQFYAAVRKLTADEKTRKEMGIRARTLYEEKYNWNIMKGILLRAYEDLRSI